MFDPYHKWLSILPKDQPPNHYRLLGVEIFESDLDVIEAAADRQMSFVRQYQSGEHSKEAAKLLNELATARICLLKPASKVTYDEKLRKEQSSAESGLATIDLSFADNDQNSSRSPRKKSTKRVHPKPTNSSQMMWIGGGAAAIVGLLLIAVLLSRGSSKPQRATAAESANVATPSIQNSIPSAETGRTPTASETASLPESSPFIWADTPLVSEPVGTPIDLLKPVDISRDVVAGNWEATSSGLVGAPLSRIYLPSKLPEDYQLKFAMKRLEGTDAIAFGFMMAGRQGVLILDGWTPAASGIYLDGHDVLGSCTYRPGRLFKEQLLGQIVLTIHPGHFHATFDGKTIVDWHGDPMRLFFPTNEWNTGCREQAILLTYAAKYAIESASLIPIKPEPSPKRLARPDREIELLPLVDPDSLLKKVSGTLEAPENPVKNEVPESSRHLFQQAADRDSARNIWTVSKKTVSSPAGHGQLYLPVVVPEEYTLSATIELPPEHQGEYALTIGLVAGASYCQFASTQGDTGLEMIDGIRWNANETRQSGPLFKPGVPVHVDCTVTRDGIRVEGDGKTLIDWHGDFRRLSMNSEWSLVDARRLFLGSRNHFKIRDIKLGPPIAAPKLPEHPPLWAGKSIDLLPLIDPVRDAIEGTWERDGTALRCKGDVQDNKLVIPLDVPEEYQLTARVARIPGGKYNDNALVFGIPMGRAKMFLWIDAYSSTVSGLFLNNSDINRNPRSFRGSVIPAESPRELVIVVRKDKVQVTCEGTTIVDWSGNPDLHPALVQFVTPGRRLSLGSFHQGLRFDKLELEPLLPTKVPAASPLAADGKLLPLMNADRDSLRGDWKLDADGLRSPSYPGARIRIPVTAPDKYILSASVERRQRGGSDFFFGLVVSGHPCAAFIDGGTGTEAGLEWLDHKGFADVLNYTHRKYASPLLPSGKPVQIRCYVLPDTVVVTCDEKEAIRWHGDPRRLGKGLDRDLVVGCHDTVFLVRDLQLKPMPDKIARQLLDSFSGVFPMLPQVQEPLIKSTLDSNAE